MIRGAISRIPDGMNASARNEVALLRRPGSMLLDLQHVHGNDIGLRARRPPFDVEGEFVGQESFEFVEGMFSEAFWARTEREGCEALRPGVMEWRRLGVCRSWRLLHSPVVKPEEDVDKGKKRCGRVRYVLPKKFH